MVLLPICTIHKLINGGIKMTKKILCVGVFGHENTYILAALIKKSLRENPSTEKFIIKCAGIEEESVREYPPCKSFFTVMHQLGYFPSKEAFHPIIERDAGGKNLIPIQWSPNALNEIKGISLFDIFITPYQSVLKKLAAKRYAQGKELLLACHPNGIGLDCCPANAAEKMMPWVRNYFGN